MKVFNFENWKINESVTQFKKITLPNDNDFKNIFNIFKDQFVNQIEDFKKDPNFKGDWKNLTWKRFGEIAESYIKDNAPSIDNAGDFFKSKGYTWPDPRVKKAQSIISNKTGVTKFINNKGEESKFEDGKFGSATAKAFLLFMRNFYHPQISGTSFAKLSIKDRDAKIKAIQQGKVKGMTAGKSPDETQEVASRKVKGGSIQTGTDTQTAPE